WRCCWPPKGQNCATRISVAGSLSCSSNDGPLADPSCAVACVAAVAMSTSVNSPAAAASRVKIRLSLERCTPALNNKCEPADLAPSYSRWMVHKARTPPQSGALWGTPIGLHCPKPRNGESHKRLHALQKI